MELFLNFIQVSIGARDRLGVVPTKEEWENLLAMAVKQALVGVLYDGITRLPKEERPPKPVLLQWFTLTEQIKSLNRSINNDAVYVHQYFREAGYENVMLKGQGIATYYPQPLLRNPGDIDLWVKGEDEKVLRYLSSKGDVSDVTYIHAQVPMLKTTDVEIHYRPSYLRNYFYNRRLQMYFSTVADEQFKNKVCELGDSHEKISVPTLEFNRFYILLHIYRHLFGEGIGLRQMLDYYYVLRKGGSAESKAKTVRLFRSFGMYKFLGATMWVQQQVFALEDEFLLCSPNEKAGKFLLKEILLSGNFGQRDERIDRSHYDRISSRVVQTVKRNMRFLFSYPQEVLFDLPFRVWRYFWRKKMTVRCHL